MNVEQTVFDVRQHESKEMVTDKSEKGEYLIEYFLRDKDVAPWFRGTSIFHLQGSDELFNAIRDDTEQRTTHRVMNCLNLIGLDPMITSNETAFLMRLSRGNDLAFLWFLMEMHYKSPQSANNDVNEQLICTAICHLDMITTLRELDKILPNGHPPQRNSRQVAHSGKGAAQLSMEGTKRQMRGPKYVLPYFEKLRRPTTYGMPLTIEIPNYEVDFYLYGAYKDPNYKVTNESNRWYADYGFNAGRRVAYDIIRNAISDIFENFEAAKLKADTIKVLCQHHKALKRHEENFKHELRVKIRDKCLKSIFGNDLEKRKQRLCRVKESLHLAIEQQLCDFRCQTTFARKELTLKTLTSDCEMVDVVIGGEYDDCCRMSSITTEPKTSASKAVIQGSGDTVATKVQNNSKDGAKGTVKRNGGTGDFENVPLPKTAVDNLKQSQLNSSNVDVLLRSQSPSQMSVFASKYMQTYNYGRVGDTPKPSQTFFHANTNHRPYQFDYRKIFLYKGDHANGTKARIKEAFLEALDRDIATLTELEVAQSNLNLIASECATNTWRCELSKYEVEHQQNMTTINKARYDPEDKNLMDKMLADAFVELRKNPKFVLAQLPEAHKLPMLREWISRRYGKVYSPKERILSYQYSLQIFHALDRMSFDFPTPTATQLGTNQFVKYNCRNYLVQKIKHIKDKFYRRLDNEIMKQSRNYWFAMRGYLCSNGPPRQTFFAYMPSRFRDIQHFRLWKSSEHRPDKMEWDKRLLASKRG